MLHCLKTTVFEEKFRSILSYKTFQMARLIVLIAAIAALMATLFVATESARTCEAKFNIANILGKASPDKDGFDICLFNKTDNGATKLIGIAGNSLWETQFKLGLGRCYCNQDCSPPQIVCRDPIDLGFGNITNGVSQIVYGAVAYQVYCFCPQYRQPDVYPCTSPPTPSLCNPE